MTFHLLDPLLDSLSRLYLRPPPTLPCAFRFQFCLRIWSEAPRGTGRGRARDVKRGVKTRDWAPSANRRGLRSAVLKLELIDAGLSNSTVDFCEIRSSLRRLISSLSEQSEDNGDPYARLGESAPFIRLKSKCSKFFTDRTSFPAWNFRRAYPEYPNRYQGLD